MYLPDADNADDAEERRLIMINKLCLRYLRPVLLNLEYDTDCG